MENDKLVWLSDVAAIIDDHLNRFNIDGNSPIQSTYAMAHTHIKEILKFIPAVDAVEVVRCRGCAFREDDGECTGPLAEATMPPEWFCAGGKRRKEAHNAAD